MKTHSTLIAAAVVLSILILGCNKKRDMAEELQEPVSMSTLTTMAAESDVRVQPTAMPVPVQPQATLAQTAALEQQATPPGLAALPPLGPYPPALLEIQAALKNAGLYTGAVDGKAGPLTKKAIEEFQKANNLKVDGKVGPQTWGLLSTYLAAEAPAPATQKKKK